MTELIWDGKYKDGKKQGPVRIALPFQTIETVNESAQDRRLNLELFASGRDTEWRNRLIWGDKKYVLPSLLAELAGKIDLIYIDPPFDTARISLSPLPFLRPIVKGSNLPSNLRCLSKRHTETLGASIQKTGNVVSLRPIAT